MQFRRSFIGLTLMTLLACEQTPPEFLTYHNSYLGLVTGKSTLAEVEAKLGKIKSTETTVDGKNYRFEQVTVNFSGEDPTKIGTIAITSDKNYKSLAGVSLGEGVESLESKIPHVQAKRRYHIDRKEGVVYWTDGEKVVVIVLAGSLVKR